MVIWVFWGKDWVFFAGFGVTARDPKPGLNIGIELGRTVTLHTTNHALHIHQTVHVVHVLVSVLAYAHVGNPT